MKMTPERIEKLRHSPIHADLTDALDDLGEARRVLRLFEKGGLTDWVKGEEVRRLEKEHQDHIKRVETVMRCSIDARDGLWKEAAKERDRLREQLQAEKNAVMAISFSNECAVKQAVAAMRERCAGIVEDLFRQGRTIREVAAAIRREEGAPDGK